MCVSLSLGVCCVRIMLACVCLFVRVFVYDICIVRMCVSACVLCVLCGCACVCAHVCVRAHNLFVCM